MTDSMKLEAIFAYIRDNGVLQKPEFSRMGGMWSVDTWNLGPYRGQLSESERIVGEGSISAFSDYHSVVHFSHGSSAEWLDSLYNRVVVEKFTV